MKIAITGANGHVGVNLCRELLKQGHQVKALAHKNQNGLSGLDIELIHGDLLEQQSLLPFIDGAEVCFHLAATISIKGDPDGMVRKINVEGTRNILKVASTYGIKRFIHFSSIHAFSQVPLNEPLDELRPLVTDTGFAYDRSKAEGERLVQQAVREGLDAVILSPTAIIGPADYQPSLTGKALIELFNKKIPALVPGGYNWIDVRDVVDGAIASIEKGRTGEKYLLSGHWHDLTELSGMIHQITGVNTTRTVIPLWLAKAALPFITAYSLLSGIVPLYTKESLQIIGEGNRYISNEKAKKELGFHPRLLKITINDTIDWFRTIGFIN